MSVEQKCGVWSAKRTTLGQMLGELLCFLRFLNWIIKRRTRALPLCTMPSKSARGSDASAQVRH